MEVNMKTAFFRLLATMTFVFSTVAIGAGQSSASYKIPADTLNNGVGDMSSASYKLSSSLGDAAATALLTSASFKLAAGFRGAISVSSATLNLLLVKSQKLHGGAAYNLTIDHHQSITGQITVEPRAIGGGHTLVFHFDQPVSTVGAATALNALIAKGNATAVVDIHGDVVVTLTNVADNNRLTITLSGLNGLQTAQASMGFLVGDVSNTHAVTTADISAIKANLNKPVSSDALAKFDLNADGTITQADVSSAKARSGLVLAP
jgi:hypothetical protein